MTPVAAIVVFLLVAGLLLVATTLITNLVAKKGKLRTASRGQSVRSWFLIAFLGVLGLIAVVLASHAFFVTHGGVR